jgi:hypothetical protein
MQPQDLQTKKSARNSRQFVPKPFILQADLAYQLTIDITRAQLRFTAHVSPSWHRSMQTRPHTYL